MLDLKYVTTHLDELKEMLQARHTTADLDRFAELDDRRKTLLYEVEGLKHERNQVSEKIGYLKREKKDADDLISRMKEVSTKIAGLDSELKIVQEELQSILYTIPNIPHTSVPSGKGEEDNKFLRSWGSKPEFVYEPRSHDEIGKFLGLLDTERASKITGTRFALLKGKLALMERALLQFMLDVQTRENGYTEVLAPFIVNRDSAFGTGQLPKFEDDLFKIQDHEFFLIPTAEVSITNIHRDEILETEQLPIKYCGYSPCFRREAGSHGKDTKGLMRQHQFQKIELVKFCEPDTSYQELEKLLADAESILRKLNLHYQIVTLCTGDLGFGAAKCYDIEVWIPSQDKYREISSCSNYEDFQARRAKIRYRPEGAKKTAHVHTLNGSGMAIGRTIIAILEQYQNEDGSVTIPEVLRPYMGDLEIIEAVTKK